MPINHAQNGDAPAFYGMKEAAAMAGVTLPRLVAWLRNEGWLVRDAINGNWQPCLSLGPDAGRTIRSKRFKTWTVYWSEAMVERMRSRADEITNFQLPARGAPVVVKPTDKQIELISEVTKALGIRLETPPASKKLATKLIEDLLNEKRIKDAQLRRISPATEKQVEYVLQLAGEIGRSEDDLGLDNLTHKEAQDLIEEMLYERDHPAPKM